MHFSPPVNREVTSADVAYAIERAANPNVANAYFQSYFGAGASAPLVGATSANYKGGPIPGIQTPNKYTIVFHTVKPSGAFLVEALSLPISAPVPGELRRAAGQAVPDDLWLQIPGRERSIHDPEPTPRRGCSRASATRPANR